VKLVWRRNLDLVPAAQYHDGRLRKHSIYLIGRSASSARRLYGNPKSDAHTHEMIRLNEKKASAPKSPRMNLRTQKIIEPAAESREIDFGGWALCSWCPFVLSHMAAAAGH
jgi:hypothetical protein